VRGSNLTSTMQRIVTLTPNPSIDLSTTVARVVAEDKLRCAPPRRDPGGGGLNVARALHYLGGASVAVHTAGGPSGDMLCVLLDQAGIARRTVSTRHWTRQNLHVEELSTNRQYRFDMPGPELSEDEWRGCLAAVSSFAPAPDYLVASGSLPPGVPDDFYAELARWGRGQGARVVVDTSGAALVRAVEAGVYAIKPNLRELTALAGQALDREDQQERACRRLVESGRCEVVLASLGPGGALLCTAEGAWRIRAPDVPARSRVGAGDSTVAGFVLALTRGLDVVEAARFGVAAGTAAVMTPGTELCRREDAEALYARMER
jgi:6-phosphofructokinase 2